MIKNAEYNADIAANSSVHISIVAGEGAAEERPENFIMQQTVVGAESTGTEGGNEEVPEDEMDAVIAERLKGVKYKEPEAQHVQYNEDTDTYYVDNQLALIVKDGVTMEQVENYAKELEAVVVGYIVVTGDYQLEFLQAKTWEELHVLVEKVSANDWVEDILLQELFEIDLCVTPDDPAWYVSDSLQGVLLNKWDENFPAGNNWGLEAINARGAWEYDGEKVKVGIIDTMFDEEHEDLEFVKTWGNEFDVAKLYQNPKNSRDAAQRTSHGTHVAGTIGATYNNGKGITGVAKNVELYAVAMGNRDINQMGAFLRFKYALANLIFCECKVINVSMSQDVGDIEEEANIFEAFLMKLLKLGYDFVIVQAAGNDGTDASSSGLFVNINEPELKDRIIVVGSVKLNKPIKNEYYYMQKYTNRDFLFGGYSYYAGANHGDRVDVCAPGVNIYSTVPGNGYTNIFYRNETWIGTSMAAPHVSGVVAMCYSVNPKLTGIQVKEIVCGSVNRYATRNLNERYPLVNAEKAVYVAMNTRGQLPELEPVLQGIILGEVREYEVFNPNCPPNKGVSVDDVKVFVYTVNNNDGTLGELVDNIDLSDSGEFSFILPEGVYCIMVYSDKYLPIMKTNIRVSVGQIENVIISAYKKVENGEVEIGLEGIIKNAVSGTTVSRADVEIYLGLIENIGELEESIRNIYYENTIVSDADGKYSCKLSEGCYTLLIKKEGYIDSYMHVVCMRNGESGSEVVQQDIVLSPLMNDGEYRIVLTWGERPGDLDSHLEGYYESECIFHVYYMDKQYIENGELVAYLDRDDTSSYGPETITLTLRMDNDVTYKYYVRDYTNGGSSSSMVLSFSGAKVEVYSSEGKLEEFTIEPNQYGTRWDVFEIENGKIIQIENDNVA